MITTEQIRKLIEEKKVTIGATETARALSADEIKTLVIATNAQASVKESILHTAALNGTTVDGLAVSNEVLGTMCKKPFSISILGIRK